MSKEKLRKCLNCKGDVGLYKEGNGFIILCKYCGLYLGFSSKENLDKIWNNIRSDR